MSFHGAAGRAIRANTNRNTLTNTLNHVHHIYRQIHICVRCYHSAMTPRASYVDFVCATNASAQSSTARVVRADKMHTKHNTLAHLCIDLSANTHTHKFRVFARATYKSFAASLALFPLWRADFLSRARPRRHQPTLSTTTTAEYGHTKRAHRRRKERNAPPRRRT